ncbi:MAG: DUF1365 domain-containing protein [Actinomycetota bacterium]|nr:DUF1365 domain-containing protein [Actinomycetota bacterium]
MKSGIYEGQVRHRRFEPFERQFDYRIFMVYLDLEEIPDVMSVHPLWSTRRRSPARFRRDDYLGPVQLPLRDAVARLVRKRTGRTLRGPVRMLTNLRYWGLIENPVTFYYCFDPAGERVETVIAEVTNTPWGERHSYVIQGDGSKVVSARLDKQMHVSPLMGMDHVYDLRFGTPGSRLPVHISSSRDRQISFDATLNLQRTEISRRSLGRLLVTYPPMSYRTTVGIHRQAAISWLRGAKYHPKPAATDLKPAAQTARLCPVHSVSEPSAAVSGKVA